MNTIMTFIAASSLLAAPALAQQATHYTVTDLGAVGGGQPYFVNNLGLVSGSASASSTMHAALWYGRTKFDIGSRGLGGPNSAAFGVNVLGQVVGEAETAVSNNEDFCGFNAYGFPSSTACVPFLWQNGVMKPLPTLGGANGVANWINDPGQVAGYAENQTPQSDCPVFEFKLSSGNMAKSRNSPRTAGIRAEPPSRSTTWVRRLAYRVLAQPLTRISDSTWWTLTRCCGKTAE
jgi:uncharacterized membrane protein